MRHKSKEHDRINEGGRRPPRESRIALALDRRQYHQLRALEGVYGYARPTQRWIFRFLPTLGAALSDVLEWQPHGIIMGASPNQRRPEDSVLAAVPIVTIGSVCPEWATTSITYDNGAAGRAAARHLLERPLASAACIYNSSHPGACARRDGFRDAIQQAGRPYAELDEVDFLPGISNPDDVWSRPERVLTDWLAQLPKPCGLFCWQDALGWLMMDACFHAGILIPEDILVAGANNAEQVCQLTYPTLSSVSMPFQEAGFCAAQMLHRLMEGGDAPAQPVVLSPGDVVQRDSTRRVLSDDPLVRRAMSLIDGGWADDGNIGDLCTELGCTRRNLERGFQKSGLASPHRMLQEYRVRKATALLEQGLYTVDAIARECGLGSPQALHAMFKRITGKPPRAFRRFGGRR